MHAVVLAPLLGILRQRSRGAVPEVDRGSHEQAGCDVLMLAPQRGERLSRGERDLLTEQYGTRVDARVDGDAP